MKIDPKDPRITNYILNELSDSDRAQFEAELKDDPEARKYVADMQKLAGDVKLEYQNLPSAKLTPDRRRRVLESKPSPERSDKIIYLSKWFVKYPLAIAATLVVGLCIIGLFTPALSRSRSSSRKVYLQSEALVAPEPREVDEIAVQPSPKPAPQMAAPMQTQNVQLLNKVDKDGEVSKLSESAIKVQGYEGKTFAFGGVAGGNAHGLSSTFNVASPDISPNRVERGNFNTETYDHQTDNPFKSVKEEPLSTFSLDVDTASYSNIRRMINQGSRPPVGAVRIEELINYFPYQYHQPEGKDPFAVDVETAGCPWAPSHRLARIALKAREIPAEERPVCNLVFLIDVSGSMNEENKLPLVKKGLKMLVKRLNKKDRVAIVVYAGNSGLVLPSTRATNKEQILEAIDRLEAGGSTNGAQGIQLAYQTAVSNFIEGGSNRVILATDGDFNVGVTNQDELVRLIEEKAKSGVFLNVLGFGMGNYKDSTLEKLADKGNGMYAYIDSSREARKVLVEQMGGSLVTLAKDVKIQIEFNPAEVNGYRLIGYENRILQKEDFNNDKKDAGEIGAGHEMTAFYEIIPAGIDMNVPAVDPLKYQRSKSDKLQATNSDEMMTVKLRYKQPDADKSKLLEFPIKDSQKSFAKASEDFRFGAAVAGFGMILRESPYKGHWNFEDVIDTATGSSEFDPNDYRKEFVQLVKKAKQLMPRKGQTEDDE